MMLNLFRNPTIRISSYIQLENGVGNKKLKRKMRIV